MLLTLVVANYQPEQLDPETLNTSSILLIP